MSLLIISAIGTIAYLAVMAWERWELVNNSTDSVIQQEAKPYYITLAHSWGPLCVMIFVVLILVNYFNFALILTLATFIAFVATVVNKFVLAPKRKVAIEAYKKTVEHPDQAVIESLSKAPAGIEFVSSLFSVLLVVFVLRSFIVEPFQIPSGSMKPTLEVGDFILVNKSAYGVRLPVLNTVMIPVGTPQRGDVVVFHYPPDPSVDYIKRVVGIPGDRIRYTKDKRLYLNDQLISEEFKGDISEFANIKVQYGNNEIEEKSELVNYKLYKEKLGDVEHSIYKMPERGSPYDMQWTVPEGYYFMMGDNRDDSKDSRFWITDYQKRVSSDEFKKILQDDKMYMVPDANIVGKAFLVWMHWPDPKLSNLPSFSNDRFIK